MDFNIHKALRGQHIKVAGGYRAVIHRIDALDRLIGEIEFEDARVEFYCWDLDGTDPTVKEHHIIGMWDGNDPKPFDLTKALRGEPVKLRNGKIAYIKEYDETKKFPIIGMVDGELNLED